MAERLRIGQVLTASTGGIGRHVASVVRRLIDAGQVVQVWCPPATAAQHLAGIQGLQVHPLTDLGRLRGADIVHAHGYRATALAGLPARRAGIRLVSSWHNDIPPAPSQGGRLPDHLAGLATRRAAALVADLVLGASADLVRAARALGTPAEPGPVAAPTLAAVRRDRATVRAELGADPSATVMLTIGRLAPQKNLGMLMEIASQLVGRPELQFWLAGDGPERAAVAATIAQRNLRVTMLGRRDDVPDLLAAADVCLLTSRWEARALVAQEALQAGLPLLATRVGGIPELVGAAAMLVRSSDAAGAASGIEQLAAHPDRRRRLRALGLAQAATWPDEDQVADAVLAAYRRLLAI
ncbi:MAG: glycosyltransferase family 4 protein [Propionibacteriaceae bacterium]